jgi:hypothetical protein
VREVRKKRLCIPSEASDEMVVVIDQLPRSALLDSFLQDICRRAVEPRMMRALKKCVGGRERKALSLGASSFVAHRPAKGGFCRCKLRLAARPSFEVRGWSCPGLKVVVCPSFCIVEIQDMAPKHKDGDVVAVVREGDDCNSFANC